MKNRAKPSISELADLLKMSKNGGIFPPKKMWDFRKMWDFAKMWELEKWGILQKMGDFAKMWELEKCGIFEMSLTCVPNVFQNWNRSGFNLQ